MTTYQVYQVTSPRHHLLNYYHLVDSLLLLLMVMIPVAYSLIPSSLILYYLHQEPIALVMVVECIPLTLALFSPPSLFRHHHLLVDSYRAWRIWWCWFCILVLEETQRRRTSCNELVKHVRHAREGPGWWDELVKHVRHAREGPGWWE